MDCLVPAVDVVPAFDLVPVFDVVPLLDVFDDVELPAAAAPAPDLAVAGLPVTMLGGGTYIGDSTATA